MKIVLVLVLVLVLGSCAAPRPSVPALPVDARLADPDRTPFVVAERYRGHVVVLDFWAGWCEECKRSVPQVTRLAAAFASDGLIVIGVNAGEQPAEAEAAARALGIGYPIALDPDLAFSAQIGASDLPALLVIDRSGAIVHRARHVDEASLAVIRAQLASR